MTIYTAKMLCEIAARRKAQQQANRPQQVQQARAQAATASR